MTQPGKRRREGVVEAPDLDGLYEAQKAVKKRRTGVVKPPVLEELQLPEHHAVLAGNGDANNNSAVIDRDTETTNGHGIHEREKEEATKSRHCTVSSTSDEDPPKQDEPSPVVESTDAKDEKTEDGDEDDKNDESQIVL